MNRTAALGTLEFGWGTAEKDLLLKDTFIETEMWRAVYDGGLDVVLGGKGAGKSAIYRRLFGVESALKRRGVQLAGAESVDTVPLFQELLQSGGLSTREFASLWKLYF